ncbi:MAG: acetyl-CoA carboxylase biotin carboxyl carrier protein subunit [Proteobacteria bacterium]|nr:acetyl-CoA carboxylase biotin carboxyl carrier protein subunit [Pseudomonadota bacterium]
MHSTKLEAITRIIESFGKSGADEVEIVEGSLRIRLRRFAGGPVEAAAVDAALGESAMEAAKPSQGGTPAAVPAPMHGVFHRAPAPGAEPFVSVGSKVQVGQQLCILEAMKVFNAFASPRSGVVVAIHAENGADVMAGQALFTIEPEGAGA